MAKPIPIYAALLLGTCFVVGVPIVAGCSSEQYDPNFWHENFVNILQSNVGRKLQNVQRGGWAQDQYLVDRTTLPDGNIAYKYRSGGTCRYTFEVDPKTDIIVAATWEGEARHCIIIP